MAKPGAAARRGRNSRTKSEQAPYCSPLPHWTPGEAGQWRQGTKLKKASASVFFVAAGLWPKKASASVF